MFFAGVALTHAVFYFDKKRKKKMFYLFLSSIILQILNNTHLCHLSALEFAKGRLKTFEESEEQEYLEKESKKLSAFMELYVLLLIRAVPKEGRSYINYKSWSEAESIIKELRGFMKNEKGQR